MAAAHHDAPIDAPVSPAPGTAIPVPVADVEAAVAGERVAGRPIAAAMNPAADLSSLPSGPIAGPNAPALPDTPADNRGPGPAPGRNNRFAGTPRSQQVAAAPAAGPPASAGSAAGPPTSIRPAYTGSGRPADSLPSQRGGGSPPAPPPHGPGPSGPGGAGPSRPHRTQGRRVLFVAAAVALLGVAVYGWSLTATAAGSNDGRSPKSLPEPSIVAATGKCVVSYAVWSDTGDRFKATVTVANRDNAPIKNWNLWFIMQGDQTVSGNGKVQLTQQGTAVTVKSPGTLNPQNAVTLDVTGRYDASNQPPMVFELDNKTCETYVSGKPGEPSRPVQKLANGKGYTFGPPAKDNPAPGIIIGPGGVVTPGPLPTTTGAAGTTTPPTTGTTTTTTTTTTPTATATTTTTTNAGGGGNNGPGPGPGCQSNCPTADPTTTDPTTEPTDSTVTTPPGEPDPGTDDTDTDPADE
nr:cellulose binding domain-containing protein [Jidongwangia harbinensis]